MTNSCSPGKVPVTEAGMLESWTDQGSESGAGMTLPQFDWPPEMKGALGWLGYSSSEHMTLLPLLYLVEPYSGPAVK